jgi:hypothetical protein
MQWECATNNKLGTHHTTPCLIAVLLLQLDVPHRLLVIFCCFAVITATCCNLKLKNNQIHIFITEQTYCN